MLPNTTATHTSETIQRKFSIWYLSRVFEFHHSLSWEPFGFLKWSFEFETIFRAVDATSSTPPFESTCCCCCYCCYVTLLVLCTKVDHFLDMPANSNADMIATSISNLSTIMKDENDVFVVDLQVLATCCQTLVLGSTILAG